MLLTGTCVNATVCCSTAKPALARPGSSAGNRPGSSAGNRPGSATNNLGGLNPDRPLSGTLSGAPRAIAIYEEGGKDDDDEIEVVREAAPVMRAGAGGGGQGVLVQNILDAEKDLQVSDCHMRWC